MNRGGADGEGDGRSDEDAGETAGEARDEYDGEGEDEYADWGPPSRAGGDDAPGPEAGGGEGPPTVRAPLLRDRVRDRLGVTPRQWYVVESLLLAAPYPVFVAAYLWFDVNETLFLLVTLAYSLVATYVGFLS